MAPGTDLSAITRNSPAGTTFWLSSGTHTLASDQFGQVIPKNGNVYLGAPGAVLDGRGINQAAFTQEAADVVIRGLTIRGFVAQVNQGVVNHDSGPRWVIENNIIEDNDGAAMMAGTGQQVLGNCLRNNGQYGINVYRFGGGLTDLVIEGNEISGSNTDDWETQIPGCGCSGGAKFWAVDGAGILNNWVHHNHGVGLWADTNNNDFVIEGNLIEDNEAEGLFYELSYNLLVSGNTFKRNMLVQGRRKAERGDNFPVAAVYISESGGEPRLPARTDLIDIRGNMFSDNWSGVTLWENADRFCNSPANASSLSCTPLVPAVSSCDQPGIATEPLYGDCRWKTQRVSVHDNTFEFDSETQGCLSMCGRMAVLSNYGTWPTWSPYRGSVISDAITFRQENRWFDNQYHVQHIRRVGRLRLAGRLLWPLALGWCAITAAALRSITAQAIVLPAEKDPYFPPEDEQWACQHLANAEHRVIPGVWGHFAGGGANPVDTGFIDAALKELLAR